MDLLRAMDQEIDDGQSYLGVSTSRCRPPVRDGCLLTMMSLNLVILITLFSLSIGLLIEYRPEINQVVGLLRGFNETGELSTLIRKASVFISHLDLREIELMLEKSYLLLTTLNPREIQGVTTNSSILFRSVGNISQFGHQLHHWSTLLEEICRVLKCQTETPIPIGFPQIPTETIFPPPNR